MRTPIRPREIEVPSDDVFKNDLLDRRKEVKALTQMLSSADDSYVIAVDAPWGYGKTTFIRLLNQHLKLEKFHVISFNAWESDFTNQPFAALLTELKKGIKKIKETLENLALSKERG